MLVEQRAENWETLSALQTVQVRVDLLVARTVPLSAEQ